MWFIPSVIRIRKTNNKNKLCIRLSNVMAAIYGTMYLLFTCSSLIRSNEESATLLTLAWRLDFFHLPTILSLALCFFFLNEYFRGNCSDFLFTIASILYELRLTTRLAAKFHQIPFELSRYSLILSMLRVNFRKLHDYGTPFLLHAFQQL